MKISPVPFRKCLFVCENSRDNGATCCGPTAQGFRDYLKTAIKARGLAKEIRVAKAGCLDRCGDGPNIFVYPDGRWYSGVTQADLDHIIAQEIV